MPAVEKVTENPTECIKCESRNIRMVKKLPRTFKCNENHSFTVAQWRKSVKEKKRRF